MEPYESVEYSVIDGRAEIILNRPEVLNALHPEMLAELNDAILTAIDDSSVSVLILSGNGRGFCSGADVKGMSGRDDREDPLTYREHLGRNQNVVRQLHDGPKPTIAAINGPAVGVGCDFALACDLRLMSETAYLREQFVNIGLVSGDGGAWLLPRLIGESKAKQYLMTGTDITPEESIELGLVMEITDDGETLDTARSVADDLISKPQSGLRGIKNIVDITQSFEEHVDVAFDAQWECIHDLEHEEAVSALVEGRDPTFDR